MSRAHGIILDLDGTVYRNEQLIPGAPEAIQELRRRGHPIVFVTNAIESCAEHAAKLARFGIPTRPEEVINATQVLIQHLKRQLPQATVFAISDPPLVQELSAHFSISENPDEIDVVIASCDRNFNFYKLNVAFQALRRGARFWATNADATCPVPGGEIPDAGAIIGALEGCSKRQVELVAGKPSPLVIQTALEQLERRPDECLIVGDRLETDILMGQRAGVRTALVLTGVTQRADLPHAPVQPDHVLDHITQILQICKCANLQI
jgi:arabinose operon protein AraL